MLYLPSFILLSYSALSLSIHLCLAFGSLSPSPNPLSPAFGPPAASNPQVIMIQSDPLSRRVSRPVAMDDPKWSAPPFPGLSKSAWIPCLLSLLRGTPPSLLLAWCVLYSGTAPSDLASSLPRSCNLRASSLFISLVAGPLTSCRSFSSLGRLAGNRFVLLKMI